MKIKFDSNQEHQQKAVSALIDLFEGQPLVNNDYSLSLENLKFGLFGSMGNGIVLSTETIYKNLIAIQERNDLEPISQAEFEKNEMNFSVEMETGTGKTYVYLKTIFELNQKYGFLKFIIVVPSVAIREGTLKNLQITKEHFKTLYNNIPCEYFVYDGKKANKLRSFATNNQLQIMIINIDSFRKDFSDNEDQNKKSNIIFKENDKLSGHKPIEFIQSVNPFVIIDEPQSVDNTPKSQEAIKSLNPCCIFRFSATHKNLYNLVYKLDPIKAYQLRLVKQIIVASVTGENAQNDAYVKLLEVNNKKGIKAKIRIQIQEKNGIKEKDLWVKQGADLYELSNNRINYKNGFEITEINAEPSNEYIDFAMHGRLTLNAERGGIKDDLTEIQIRNTIKKHLDKEIQVKDQGIKVLSLFFIDRVSNYRIYDEEGKSQKGKFAILFEKHYNELIKLSQYQCLENQAVEQVHDGYFSQDKKGILKDTIGTTLADDDTYSKIMRNKEQLLSLEEPLKFIFSHSALREGWDNPNVFQICTLNETNSVIKKRQEIGRGLRLPVNQNGERIFDDNINKLTVIANESYDEFAFKLQNEYEQDCGVIFGKVPLFAFKNIVQTKEDSENIWKELQKNGFIDQAGKIQNTFNPLAKDFSLKLPEIYAPVEAEIISILQDYKFDKHIKKDEEPKRLKINEQIFSDPEFENLWNKIKYKTTYQVEYSTEKLIEKCIESIEKMDKIEPIMINYKEASVSLESKGILTQEIKFNTHKVNYIGGLPDIISYIQKQTELTRKTLIEIIKKSNRIPEFSINPQKFMDELIIIINKERHRLMIDGIQYEKLTVREHEWSMQLFRKDEMKSYFEQCLEVKKSIFDRIIYQSEIERKFAQDLDKRDDIKLFVKLPSWFKIETPLGTYNPDWAIVKHEDQTIYLVRETKSTKNFDKLRNYETDKIHCGKKHFESLGVDFNIAISASEI